MLNELKEKVSEIEMPDEMRARIIKNCYSKMEEDTMKKNIGNRFFKKPMAAAVSLSLLICLTGVTALAGTDKLEGFFKDITRWDGAVVGTSYEQAANELELKVRDTEGELEIEVIYLTPDKAPYMYFEQLGIHAAQIVDRKGTVIAEEIVSELSDVQDGKATIRISLENLDAGDYMIQISELMGSKKADQPLILYGNWECEFTWNDIDTL